MHTGVSPLAPQQNKFPRLECCGFIREKMTAQFESSIKHIPYSQERVYNKLSDLNNIASIQEHMDSLKGKLEGKLEDLTFDRDSLTIKVQGISLTLRIIEREPMKCIKFEGEQSPIPLNLWIQILPVTEEEAKLKTTIRAEVNMFMKTMTSFTDWKVSYKRFHIC